MKSYYQNTQVLAVLNFLREIGLKVIQRPLTKQEYTQEFLPNIVIRNGRLIVDPLRALPGDILHEAGHVAIFPARIRPYCSNYSINSGNQMADVLAKAGIEPTIQELKALQYCFEDLAPVAWQFAANLKIGFPSAVGFATGFKGQGMYVHNSILQSVGLHMGHVTSVSLFYLRMTASKASFPTMLRWLND
jgi:hypothetical protein